MIKIHRNEDDPTTMTIDLNGDAETIAQEYVALTLRLNDSFPYVLDRAQWYLEDIKDLRKEVRDYDGKSDDN